MPAKYLQRINEEKTYSHIYNRGIEKRNLFNDKEDYEIFLTYLKDYLSAPPDPGKVKKSFSVKGRTFQGVPHQPKNYFNKVELIAYSLMPDHFHLLVCQKTSGSLEKLVRSLCTRYAIYYNKKYQRTGSLFQGPYKSVQIKDISNLLYLTHYFHHSDYSSYREFLGDRKTSWIKPNVVLSYFDKSENDYFKGIGGYKNFVEKYQLNQKEKEMFEKIILESDSEHVEKSDFRPEESEFSKKIPTEPVLEPRSKIPEFIASSAVVFVLLFALGIRNINLTLAQNKNSLSSLPSSNPQVSGLEDEQTEPNMMVIIKINDGAESVNIRKEPTTKSEKIGQAVDGDTFEFVSKEEEWYQIRLEDGLTAYVSEKYSVVEGE